LTRVTPALREFARQRASGCCEYCGRPEIHGPYPFHVDHILALKHGGSTAPDNLAWACFQCNTAKGSNIAAIDPQTGELAALFNPRKEQWDQHFRFEDGVIVGLTPAGRVTVQVLRLNEPETVEIRARHLRRGQWGVLSRFSKSE